MGVSINVFDSIAIAESTVTGGPLVWDAISVTEFVAIAGGSRYRFLSPNGSPTSSVSMIGYRHGIESIVPTPVNIQTALNASRSSIATVAFAAASAVSAGKKISFETPPLMPGPWNFAVQPRDDKLDIGNPSPNAVEVSHDLVSYWLHADPFVIDIDCMTLTYSDTNGVLTIELQPSRDFIPIGICVSDDVAVAEDRTVTVA